MTLGYALRDLGELETAVTAFARAIQIREAQEPPTGLADCLSGLAGVRIAQGDHEGAEDLLQRAVAQLEQTGQLLGLARAWLNLSSVYCAREKYDEAITLVERARELRERLGNPGHTADCCNQQGEVHRLRGDLQSAEECYQVAVHLYESIGSPWAFMPRINLALVRLDLGRTALAQHGLEAGWLEVKKAGRDGVALQIDAMLLPCYAEGGDWAAWDERMARVRGFEPGVTRVDSDSARCLDMAAKGARAAGQEQRALEAETLAAAHWKAQGRSLDG